MIKKILSLTLCTIIMLTASVSVGAENQSPTVYEYTIDGKYTTVSFADGTFTHTQQQEIADDLAYGHFGAETRGILCIFGHKYKLGNGYRTEHKVNASAPRCEQTVYNVYTCERCDHKEYEVAYIQMIFCCPED